MPTKLHVLHLARWYPSHVDSMLGLFVKNHVASLPDDVLSTVIFVWPVAGQKSVERASTRNGNIQEVTVTYPKGNSALTNLWNFYRLIRSEAFKAHSETPVQIIHIHVLTRLGVIGRRLARKFNVPYVISESWSRYFQPVRGFRQKISYQLAAFSAAGSHALIYVSNRLKAALTEHGIISRRMVFIPNVVNTEVFKPVEISDDSSDSTTLIHISCFEEASKNISGLISAVNILKNQGVDVRVRMIGDGAYRSEAELRVEKLGLSDRFDFRGTLPPCDVATAIATSDFLVQTSRYETFGAVVPEAWACGVPVISTQVGVFAEMYRQDLGEEIAGTDPASIAAGVEAAIGRKTTFSKKLIRKTAVDNYGNETVGAELKALYEEAIRAKSSR